jgi:DNA-binding response OmpR family regulator
MRQTILLADDSLTIQRLVSQTFADTSFDIVSVSNGDAATRKLDEIRPVAVLADIYMPGKNGYEVCAYVRAHATLSRIPVILLVGVYDAFDENTSNRAGATAHITKPFEPRALVELLRSVLPPDGKIGEGAETLPEALTDAHAAPGSSQVAPATSIPLTVSEASAPFAEVKGPAHSDADLLGLKELFEPVAGQTKDAGALSEEVIDKIADRVIQKLSAQVVENIAWDVVPDIAARILRDELKRNA